MTSIPKRLAIISATGTGKKRTLPAIAESNIVTATAIHGRDLASLRAVATEFDVPHTYTSVPDLIRDRHFDLAMVCSPPFMHREQVVQLLRSGIPVLVEKPLAQHLADAAAIAEVADDTGVPIRVAHHLRHQSLFVGIKNWIDSGRIGQPTMARFEWSFLLNRAAPSAAWKLDADRNGETCFTDAGIHCIDLAIGLFGNGYPVFLDRKQFSGDKTFESCHLLTRHGEIQVSMISSRQYGPYRNDLLIYGTQGFVAAEGFFTERSAARAQLTTSSGEVEYLQGGQDPYRQEVENFVAFVDGDTSVPSTSLEEAVSALSLIETAPVAD